MLASQQKPEPGSLVFVVAARAYRMLRLFDSTPPHDRFSNRSFVRLFSLLGWHVEDYCPSDDAAMSHGRENE